MTSIRSQPDELKALSEASVALTSDLSLDSVLQNVVEVACRLVSAKYAALSVLGADGKIDQFLTSGVSEEERAAIGPIPRGHGLLGVLLRKGESIRIPDLNKDERRVGFPANHPPMRSLLGMPLIYQGRIIGNLYLTDKVGADEFDARDEEIVRLLAAQAAVAIHNAEMFELEHQRSAEWKALFDLGQQVTASPHIQEVLQSVVSQARQLVQSEVATLMLLSADQSHVRLAAHEGLRVPGVQKLDLATEGGIQEMALDSMSPLIVGSYHDDDRLRGTHARLVELEGLESMIVVPVKGKQGPIGTLMVADRAPHDYTDRQAELLEAFANWTALAIESSRLYDRLESLARVEERERIGMDLHDGVMQSIYAVGLHLEDCLERVEESPDDVKQVLERAIDSLSNVIKDIRSYIFDLRPKVSVVADLPEAIRQLVDDVRVNTLMQTSMETQGSVKGLINQDEALALFHIAQEALNNVSKHSRATAVSVRMVASPQTVMVEVRDNGVGMDLKKGHSHERHGVRNMRDRAGIVGAQLAIDSAPGEGTTIRVELPVRRKEGQQ